jgi:hypothetical protein
MLTAGYQPDRTPKKVYGKEKMMVVGKDKSNKEEDPSNEECPSDTNNR